jgi:hypothetical protein
MVVVEEEEEEVPVISLCLCVYLLLQSHLIFWDLNPKTGSNSKIQPRV